MKKIQLTQGYYACVDDEDYPLLAAYKWHFSNGYATHSFRANGIKGNVLMHRLILNNPQGLGIDHINGNGLDNRRINLRACTTKQNIRNGKISKNNKSGFKGVSLVIRPNGVRRWVTYIKVDRKNINLGYYDNKIAAAKAYDEAAKEYFGEYARPNFPITIFKSED